MWRASSRPALRSSRVFDLLDFIWPRRCEVCERPVDRPGRCLCSDCLNRVPFIPTHGACSICGRAVEGMDGEYLCEDCSRRATRPDFDRAVSAFRFEGRARKMLLDYKFNRHLWLRDDFTDFLEASVRSRFEVAAIDVVVPMPVTLFHRIDRGYNQCAYLADALAKRLDRRVDGGLLKRRGKPKRQAELNEEERRENVKGTVAVSRPDWVRGRTLLLVDDVMTTGSTLSECAKVLKASGASRVWCATLARSIRD